MTAPDIVEAMDDPEIFGPWFTGASWSAWRAVLKGAFGLGAMMTSEELDAFRGLAGREPPPSRVRELWVVAGRRAGKDSIASAVAAYTAAFVDYSNLLRPGEQALVQCLAVDRDQARIVLNYTRAYFERLPRLGAMIARLTTDGFELTNNTEIAIATNSYRAVRGRGIALAIFDEIAFWKDENSASPDIETYRAVLPGLATLGGMIIGISSPYGQSGLLFEKWKKHYGQDDPEVLVIRAPSIALNPTLDQAMIDRAIAEDPDAARAEWLAEWRRDVSAFVDRAVLEAAVISDRELAPVNGIPYIGAIDASSGGGSDSFAASISHLDIGSNISVLDLTREFRPPFSPASVIDEISETMKLYGVRKIIADRYAAGFVAEGFGQRGITFEPSPRSTSDTFAEMLPLLNSGRIRMISDPRLIAQILGLERRAHRGGKDSIGHAGNAHDDLAAAAALALVAAAAGDGPIAGRGIWGFTKALAEEARGEISVSPKDRAARARAALTPEQRTALDECRRPIAARGSLEWAAQLDAAEPERAPARPFSEPAGPHPDDP